MTNREQEIYRTLVKTVKGEDIDNTYFKAILMASKSVILGKDNISNASGLAAHLFHGSDGLHLDDKYIKKYVSKVVKNSKELME